MEPRVEQLVYKERDPVTQHHILVQMDAPLDLIVALPRLCQEYILECWLEDHWNTIHTYEDMFTCTKPLMRSKRKEYRKRWLIWRKEEKRTQFRTIHKHLVSQ